MEEMLETARVVVAEYGLKVLAAIAIFIVGRLLAGLLTSMLGRVMTRARTDPTLVAFTSNLAYAGLLTFVVLAALAELGIQTTSFIAVLGAAGLAIGLALQGSLANFAAGVMLILFKPFKVGDYIEAGGGAGTVEEIMIFSTKLRSPDNKQLYIPNGQIFNGNIVNYSAKDTRRIDLVFGCSYDDDLLKAKSVLEGIVNEEERILADPVPLVAVNELADSSINFVVRPWVNSADYWAVRYALTEQVKLRFDREGLNIPYPQRDVHLHSVEAA